VDSNSLRAAFSGIFSPFLHLVILHFPPFAVNEIDCQAFASLRLCGYLWIHAKPNAKEIAACRPWLEAEISVLRPEVIVCLGATAAQALLGKQFRVSRQRGEFVKSPLAPRVMATVHPSSILRAPDEETRRIERQRFIDDLKNLRLTIDD
jgi:uracil-DNA glycosylase